MRGLCIKGREPKESICTRSVLVGKRTGLAGLVLHWRSQKAASWAHIYDVDDNDELTNKISLLGCCKVSALCLFDSPCNAKLRPVKSVIIWLRSFEIAYVSS